MEQVFTYSCRTHEHTKESKTYGVHSKKESDVKNALTQCKLSPNWRTPSKAIQESQNLKTESWKGL